MITNHIYIGFAGRRVFENDESIVALLNDVFISFDRHFSNTHFHFINGLADGSDQLASELFLNSKWDKGKDNSASLGALIAFPKDAYLDTIENKLRFSELYGQCKHAVQLDGIFLPGEDGARFRARAHRQQGKGLVILADILIVISELNDSVSSNSKDTALMALSKGIPVIFLNTADQQFYYFRNLEQWISEEKVPQTVEMIVESFYATTNPYVKSDSDILLDLTKGKKQTGYKLRAWVSGWYERFFKINSVPLIQPEFEDMSNTLSDKIQTSRKQVREFTNYYQTQYRGGYMLNYLIAVLAVLVAVTGIVLYFYIGKGFLNDNAYYAIVALGIIKTALIIIMIWNTHEVNHKQYNKKAIDCRYIAERLRINYYLAFLGFLKSPKPSLGNHIQSYLKNYSGEIDYQKLLDEIREEESDIAITRDRLPKIISFIINDWLHGQVKYHETENQKMVFMHRFLEGKAEVLSLTVLGIVFIEIVLLTGCHIFHLLPHAIVDVLSPLFMGLTILLPTVITTLNGLIFQTEARKIAFRSQLIHGQISVLLKELEEQSVYISKNDESHEYRGSHAIEVLEILYKMAAIMTDEVAEWSLLYEKPVLDQG